VEKITGNPYFMGNILVMKNLYFSNETYISWGKKPGFL
jgi:hypothetical protein